MVTRSVGSTRRGVSGVHQVAGPATGDAVHYFLRPQLSVMGLRMVDVVRFTGGWLFDRVMAGWDVTVHTPEPSDARPVRILGATAVDLESALAGPLPRVGEQAIAVDAALYDADQRVRRIVRATIDEGSAEVWVWDTRGSRNREGATGAVEHRLSVAARAFKAHALAAAAAPVESIDVTETLRSGQPDMIPAA